LLKEQIKIALEYNKSLILHNWEAKTEMLKLLSEIWDSKLEGKTVFHCCEPDKDLLEFAKQHKIYIGVDGDVTYIEAKQEYIKQVPLEMLVLETDSPYLLPEPLRKQKKYPNEPKNIPVIADYISKILKVNFEEIKEVTTENAKNLFHIK
ncbi:MAG: TatD family hydrolase, partial [bacterium]|nr:TatD family hydrolase [bacterium]